MIVRLLLGNYCLLLKVSPPSSVLQVLQNPDPHELNQQGLPALYRWSVPSVENRMWKHKDHSVCTLNLDLNHACDSASKPSI